jgi:hypothetical protein
MGVEMSEAGEDDPQQGKHNDDAESFDDAFDGVDFAIERNEGEQADRHRDQGLLTEDERNVEDGDGKEGFYQSEVEGMRCIVRSRCSRKRWIVER